MPKPQRAQDDPTAELNAPPEWLEQLVNLVAKPDMDFFDFLQEIPPAAWDACVMYLYRIDPAIKNAPGEKAYISRYSYAVTEEEIKKKHGGGKYWAILKLDRSAPDAIKLRDGNATLRNHKFRIDGEPIIQSSPAAAPASASNSPASANGSASGDTAEVVRAVIDATQGKAGERAFEGALEMLKEANKGSIELVKSNAQQQSGGNGNSTLEKFLVLAMEKMFNQPPADPLAMLEKTATILKTINPERAAARDDEDPIDAIGRLKEKMGIDLVGLLQKQKNPAAEVNPWVGFFTTLVQNAPVIINQFMQAQQQAYERAMAVAEFRRRSGLLGPAQPGVIPQAPGAIPPAPAFSPPAPMPSYAPAPPAPTAEASAGGLEIVDFGVMASQLAALVERSYEHGDPGEVAAVVVKRVMPEVVELIKPFLTDEQKQNEFIAGIPALQNLSQEEDWPEFKREFLAELLRDEEAEEKAEAAVPATEGEA